MPALTTLALPYCGSTQHYFNEVYLVCYQNQNHSRDNMICYLTALLTLTAHGPDANTMFKVHCVSDDDWVMTRCTLIRNKFHTSSAEQKPPQTYTAYTTTQQIGRFGFIVCRPLQPRYHRKKIGIVGRGLGAMEHTRGWPAIILSNAPLGNDFPLYRQCDHYTQKVKLCLWQVKQRSELFTPQILGTPNCTFLQRIYP